MNKNEYLEQVVQQQAAVGNELRKAARMKMTPEQSPLRRRPSQPAPAGGENGQAIDYRITGFWRWKTVVVPPNVYAVHTRRGHAKPLHVGLGESFRYRPRLDSFLLVPASVQTLLINANCICVERQGILVQAYLQWIIGDIETAYRKLDFSNTEDPMHVVNIQLREQAEAAIKDKVATMSIDDVLSDKQPIIEELTTRLRSVAEGTGESGGLGLKIVTVQIKEAVVSSTTVWENLQKPFRAERERVARMAELAKEREIEARELCNQRDGEKERLETADELAKLRHGSEQAAFDREQQERLRREKVSQENQRQALAEQSATEIAKRQSELDLKLESLQMDRQRCEAETKQAEVQRRLDAANGALAKARAEDEEIVEDLHHTASAARSRQDLDLLQLRRRVENELSDHLAAIKLFEHLPAIAQALPKPDELRCVQIGGQTDGLAASLAQIIETARQILPGWIGDQRAGSPAQPDETAKAK
ncbi:MAG: hypothetical protein JXR96_10395 [Deltaproteobacteria bacterium]|nr:hypothetical protein [Deltaproteobacteria bacterium]